MNTKHFALNFVLFAARLAVFSFEADGQTTPCDEPSFRSAVAAAGTVSLDCPQGVIYLTDTIDIPQGHTVTIQSVRPDGLPFSLAMTRSKRHFSVEGSLTLIGLRIYNGSTTGDEGIQRVIGEDGMPGEPGLYPVGDGQDGKDAQAPGKGGTGRAGQGGAIYITEPGGVSITNCLFENNSAFGGLGGGGGVCAPDVTFCSGRGGRADLARMTTVVMVAMVAEVGTAVARLPPLTEAMVARGKAARFTTPVHCS